MEYWHESITRKSWEVLQKIKKSGINFILIGGWAIYLWTKALKSKDIDIIIDIAELSRIKENYELKKNENLKKYEIIIDGIDIGIYVPFYSRLALPPEEIRKYTTKIEGFDVVKPEVLLMLKQAAELERGESEKGMKDRIDIMLLLVKCHIDAGLYGELAKRYSLANFPARLKMIVKGFKDCHYIDLHPRELKLEKSRILKMIS